MGKENLILERYGIEAGENPLDILNNIAHKALGMVYLMKIAHILIP